MKFNSPFPTNAGIAGKRRGGLGRTKSCKTCGRLGCRTGNKTCKGPRAERLFEGDEDEHGVSLSTALDELHSVGYTILDVHVQRQLIAEWLMSTKGDEVEVDSLDAGAPHPLPSVHLRLQSGVTPPYVCWRRGSQAPGGEDARALAQSQRGSQGPKACFEEPAGGGGLEDGGKQDVVVVQGPVGEIPGN